MRSPTSKVCSDMTGLADFPELPSAITNIGKRCFKASGITSITNFPPYVATIGEEAFMGCPALADVEIWSESLRAIEDSTFRTNQSLQRLVLTCPNLTSLGQYAISSCGSLRSVDLSSTSIATIDKCAFIFNHQLRELILPSSVASIASDALRFLGDTLPTETDEDGYSIKSTVYFKGMPCSDFLGITNVRTNDSTGMFWAPTSTKFSCMDGDIVWDEQKHKWVVNMGAFGLEFKDVPGGTTFSVAKFASTEGVDWDWGDGTVVSGCHSETDVMPHTYTTRGDYNIRIKGKLDSIGGLSTTKPFVYVEGNINHPYLTGVTIRDASENFAIGNFSFMRCTNLQAIAISDRCRSLGTYALAYTALSNVEVPTNCISIGTYTFRGCSKLEKVLVGGYGTIGNAAFTNCNSLATIEIMGSHWPTLNRTSLFTEKAVEVYANDVEGNFYSSMDADGWGMNHGSKVYAFDTDIVYENGEWVPKSKVIAINMTLQDNPYRGVSVVYPKQYSDKFPTFIVDWGDGIRETKRFAIPASEQLMSDDFNHYYGGAKGQDFTIRIIGRFSKLVGLATRGSYWYSYRPFFQGADTYPKGCKVNSIYIGNGTGIAEIGEGCFSWMTDLTLYPLPNSITRIGKSAFALSGIDSLSFLPNSITSLSPYAFAGCKELKSLVGMPSSITSLGDYCFGNDQAWEPLDSTSITNLVGMSPNVTSLGMGCFKGLNISSLEGLPQNCRELGDSCFEGCNLRNLQGLPEGILTIPDRCFCDNKIDTFVGMPSSVRNIGIDSFTPFLGTNLVGLSSSITTLGRHIISYDDWNGVINRHTTAIGRSPNLISLDGLPAGINTIPVRSFGATRAKTFMIPESVSWLYWNTFDEASRLVLLGKSDSDVYQVVNLFSRIACGDQQDFYPWASRGFMDDFCFEDPTTKSVFVNGAVFVYEFMNGYGYVSPTIVKYLPYIRATLNIEGENSTVNAGSITLQDSETPVIWDWGDGNVEWFIGEYPATHTYTATGRYEIVVTTLATKIGGYKSGPFLCIGETMTNPYMTEFSFSDSLGLQEIGSGTFANCPNLVSIACDNTMQQGIEVQPYKYLPSIRRSTSGAPHTTKDLLTMSGFPWGFSGDIEKIVGVDKIKPSELFSMKLNLKGVPAGETMVLSPFQPPEGAYVKVNWGDSSEISVLRPNETREHTYSQGGDYTIGVYCEYTTESLGGIEGASEYLPCLHRQTDTIVPSPNPYLSEVEFGDLLTITNIGKYAFSNCLGLEKINISGLSRLKLIGDYAFHNTGISNFGVIPATVTEVGKLAFNPHKRDIGMSFATPFAQLTLQRDSLRQLDSVFEKRSITFNGAVAEVMNSTAFPFATIANRVTPVQKATRFFVDGQVKYSVYEGTKWEPGVGYVKVYRVINPAQYTTTILTDPSYVFYETLGDIRYICDGLRTIVPVRHVIDSGAYVWEWTIH